MKKKKRIVRRKSRFHFRPIHLVVATVVFLGLSLYSAFAKGSGPLSFLASRADINIVTEQCGKYEPEMCVEVDGCKLSGGKCVSDHSTTTYSPKASSKPPVTKSADPYASPTQDPTTMRFSSTESCKSKCTKPGYSCKTTTGGSFAGVYCSIDYSSPHPSGNAGGQTTTKKCVVLLSLEQKQTSPPIVG
jgi:hypothetical protein